MNIRPRTPVRLGLATMLAFACAVPQAAEIAGVRLEDTVRVANQDLRLNGAGIRYKAIFKVYVAGLYLPEKKTSVPAVLSTAGARRVSITMLRDISNEEFGRGFMSGITQNSDRAETGRMIGQLQKFGEIFASIPELKKGDMLTVDWVPGSGTTIHLNGKRISEVLPDVAFYNAILKIWLGDKPIDSRLKPALLGAPEDEARGRNNS
jgi:Chalcone isomerase-like